MHDPYTQIARVGVISLWHKDPCTDGSDDSCGWFMRARHGDKAVLDKIVKRFEFDWDRTYQTSREDWDETEDGPYNPTLRFRGYFAPNGDPVFSVHSIALNLFFIAAGIVFENDGRTNWKKSRRFMRKNLFDILMFAENPTDSMRDMITREFYDGRAESVDERQDRIRQAAAMVYGWILRHQRPWYREPRWHIHHWRISGLLSWIRQRRHDRTAKAA